ncbi:unnamed protein product [Ectocarpus sp. 6 AP-2014]
MGWFGDSKATRKAKSLRQDLRGKHFIVTGANTGLGYVTARELAKMGAKVTLACRSAERGQQAIDKMKAEALEKPVKEGVDLLDGLTEVDVRLEVLDLGSLQSVVAFAQRFKASGTKVDVLVNNAGIFGVPNRRETEDGLEMQIGVNHFGGHLLTRLMEPSMNDGGRVLFLSSLAHSRPPGMPKTTWDWDNVNFDKPKTYDRLSAYCRSKLANIWDAKEFAKRLAARSINTYAVQPGLVKTEIHRGIGGGKLIMPIVNAGYVALGWVWLKGPLDGALTTVRCAVDPSLAGPELSGKYWGDMKEETPSELALDPANPPRLWEITESVLEEKLGKRVDDVVP